MVLSAKLRNRRLATPCTNYGTVGENMESGVLFVAYVEIAKEAAWAGFVVAATTAVELTLSEIRNNSQDDDEDDDEYY